MCRIWWAPNNASKWQMGFNPPFEGLIIRERFSILCRIRWFYFTGLLLKVVRNSASINKQFTYISVVVTVGLWTWDHVIMRPAMCGGNVDSLCSTYGRAPPSGLYHTGMGGYVVVPHAENFLILFLDSVSYLTASHATVSSSFGHLQS